jgi:SAM-dependent methyltransferase
MFSASAEFYDLIYSTKKDYKAEAARIAELLRRLNPQCRTVLDVACGTGEHILHLAAAGFEVDGLDVDPAFVAIGRRKHASGRFFEADMADFHLPHRYDAIICLFSSIGYLERIERVTQALRCFREHLAPGGIIVVEPWFAPDVLDSSRVFESVAEANGVRVRRTSHIDIQGRVSHLRFDYEITDATGTRHETELHELGLFTSEEMISAFHAAQLSVDYDPHGLTDRGLYVAKPA